MVVHHQWDSRWFDVWAGISRPILLTYKINYYAITNNDL
jgi:hypothetical protein